MWRDYSSGYIKNNRSAGLSIVVAAFISALLLSLLCGTFYNMWKYEVERIELAQGGWQSRIEGEFDPSAAEAIERLASVRDAVINEQRTTLDIYFNNYRAVLEDTPKITALVEVSPEKVTYNYQLLAMYMIRDPRDTAPRLLFPMFILIVLLASFGLIVIIHNAFAVSMNARIHQFGILSSVGATPKQLRACLLQEAAVLCTLPVLVGNLLGIAASRGLLQLTNTLLGSDVTGRHKAVFGYHPLLLLLTLLVTFVTIWVSAWLPALRLSRLTPLEAIKSSGDLQLKRRRHSPMLALLFGVEGELAGNAQKAQRRSLRTASLALSLSLMAFTLMQCFITLSDISTRETYFERYQDTWDVMVSLKATDVELFEEIEQLQGLPALRSAIAYQKAMTKRAIPENEMSEEAKACYAVQAADGWLVNAPIVILDDVSFLNYCRQLGIAPRLDGAIIRNILRDTSNPDFRHPAYMPYLNETSDVSLLQPTGSEAELVELPILSYTAEVPALREQYATLDARELVHFLPASLWKSVKGQLGGLEADTSICILSTDSASLQALNALQENIEHLLKPHYTSISENRIQEKEINDLQLQGMRIIFSGFCALLAIIGIGSVFSNALGFVRQRKREYARYISVGMTPGEIEKMFCLEAMLLAGKPILFTVPFAVLIVGYMLKSSYLEVELFLAEAPALPIAVFMLTILGAVALAYYLGWRSIRKISLVDVLRDDTMM